MFEYVNVSPFSHIGILRRNLPQQELDKALVLAKSYAPQTWTVLVVLYGRLSVLIVQEDARESLISTVDTRCANRF